MNARAKIDPARMIKIATLLFAFAAGVLVYVAYAPAIEAMQRRVDDAQSQLRSDEIAFSEVPRLREARRELAVRYATLFAQNPEAVFLRELSAIVSRHHLSLTMTSVRHDAPTPGPDARRALFARVPIQLELRGNYTNLLAAIADLSVGSEIVFVAAPSLHRDGSAVIASVPVTVLEPPR